MRLYQDCSSNVEFALPGRLSGCVENILKAAEKSWENGKKKSYKVALIMTVSCLLTDEDLQKTVDLIVDASNYPVSIIIVGIGNFDWERFRVLNDLGGTLKSKSGRACLRPTVQFINTEKITNTVELATEVLNDIPNQMIQFYQSKEISPESREANQYPLLGTSGIVKWRTTNGNIQDLQRNVCDVVGVTLGHLKSKSYIQNYAKRARVAQLANSVQNNEQALMGILFYLSGRPLYKNCQDSDEDSAFVDLFGMDKIVEIFNT